MIAKMYAVNRERASARRRTSSPSRNGTVQLVPTGMNTVSSSPSAATTTRPTWRARPLRARSIGAPMRKIRNGGTNGVRFGTNTNGATVAPVTSAAIRRARSNGPYGMAVNRPRMTAPAAVAVRGQLSEPRASWRWTPSAGPKNARITIGRKYARFMTLEATRTTRTHHSPAPQAPTPRYHFTMKPATGGSAAIQRAASANASIVRGIRFPIPSSSETFVFPVSTRIAPATKNIVSFANAWAAIWNVAPTIAKAAASGNAGLTRAAPMTMYESWLIVEYARRSFRSSCARARTEPKRIVAAANARSHGWTPRDTVRPGPRKKRIARSSPNTPAFTTATAWSRPLTGVGATIADGGQRGGGTGVPSPPKPATRRNAPACNAPVALAGSAARDAFPPAANARSTGTPAAICTPAVIPIAATIAAPPPSVYTRYFRPARYASSVSLWITSGYVEIVRTS